jgi:hypothetical protein
VAYTRADLMSLNHKEHVAASCNRKRNLDHEGHKEREVHNQITEPFVVFVRLRGEKASLHSVARVTIQKILEDLWQ